MRTVMATATVRRKGSTWTDVIQETTDDPLIRGALEVMGDGDYGLGCRIIADADKFTRPQVEERFREAYESLAVTCRRQSRQRGSPP